MAPVISAGLLVMCEPGEILLGHATHSRWWDIPKGLCEPGEPPREAAIRECREEFGLRVATGAIVKVGHFPYRRGKELELFAVLIARIDPSLLWCASTFVDRLGKARPEIAGYRWAPYNRIGELCAPAMAKVLLEPQRLASMMAALHDQGGTAPAWIEPKPPARPSPPR
ncbi:MAG TPA: NUDIX domain-containing protein [Casimicrobiaceae bacterium]|nr:NUDIX domain-containing protein [Casimicrobiaceae bacterium]